MRPLPRAKTTTTRLPGGRVIRLVRDVERPAASITFEWTYILLSCWMIFGSYLDGWAHTHIPQLETFFTPWHAVLYSGFLAVSAFTVGALVRNHWQGYHWKQALPAGYQLSLLGVVIFLVGGIGDLIWHTLFGIEADVDALLSPTHLVLALGAALIVTGPLRAGRLRVAVGARQDWVEQLPAVISLALLLSVLTFFTQYAHPWVNPLAASQYSPSTEDETFYRQALGVASILLQTGILMGLVLLALRRAVLPAGSLTLVFTINGLLLGLMRGQHQMIPVAIAAGLAADGLLLLLRPSIERSAQLRLFAFGVPLILYALYFLTLQLTGGIWWSVHMWTGAIVLAGITGWLASYLVVSPATQPVADSARSG
ncbi:MAG: hypothetical protein EPO21_17650 [Chloroflexota bacterium]|nr:MAG: hypothetical protein EPO21_17650 [Chloroflexota bacterium]